MNGSPREIFSFEGLGNQRLGVLMDPPKFLGKHSLVHQAKFLKTKTPFTLRMTDFVPIDQVQFSNPLVMTPLESSSNSIHFATNILRYSKTREGVQGHRLEDRVNHVGSSRL